MYMKRNGITGGRRSLSIAASEPERYFLLTRRPLRSPAPHSRKRTFGEPIRRPTGIVPVTQRLRVKTRPWSAAPAFSLPLLRRLQFCKFPNGKTPTAHILFVGPPYEKTWDDDRDERRDFAAAYLDFSRGPETEMWLYSTLEDGESGAAKTKHCEDQLLSLVEEAGKISRKFTGNRAYRCSALVGTLNMVTRDAMQRRGVIIHARSKWGYDKWLFKLDQLPDRGETLPVGMEWAPLLPEDCQLVMARTYVPRTVDTLMSLPHLSIKLHDGTPVAWGFLGPDGSLSSLHCEEPFRRQGLARTLASKLLRRSSAAFGADQWGAADVAPDNEASQAVCRSMGGVKAWRVFWVIMELESVEAD